MALLLALAGCQTVPARVELKLATALDNCRRPINPSWPAAAAAAISD